MLKAIIVLILMIGAAIGAWRMNAIQRRLAQPSAGDRCIACDSPDLETLGPNAYRCTKCGYEGGEGIRMLADQKAAAAYAGMDVHVRQQRARHHLRQAMRALAGAPLSPRDDGIEELDAWASSMETCALEGANELEQSLRAAGGVVDLPGAGEFDPTPLIKQLRSVSGGTQVTFSRATTKRIKFLQLAINDVRVALETALEDVPDEPLRPTQMSQYRT